MIINLSRCLTLSVSVVALSAIPVSAAYLNHDTRLSKSSMIDTNTHTLKSSAQSSAFIKTASVCFITDTNDCKGDEFDVAEEYPKYDPTPVDSCRYEGYLKTFCEPLYEPYNYCPYDENYWEKCVCKSEFKETCLPPYSGIGSACEGKYERCCKNDCPSGYDTSSGTCRQASSQKTECGNACYKIVDSTCKSGSLNAPSETGGYKNKIVGYTDCGAPCWQSYDDNCPSGSVKAKVTGKCYETSATYTLFGSTCYKEKACCDDTCSGYTTVPTSSQCSSGYNIGTTDCGTPCYSCYKCIAPQICTDQYSSMVSQCSFLKYNETVCKKHFYPDGGSGWGNNYNPVDYGPYTGVEWDIKPTCYSSVNDIYELMSSQATPNCSFTINKDIAPTTQECVNAAPGGAVRSEIYFSRCQVLAPNIKVNLNGHSVRYVDFRKISPSGAVASYENGTLLYPELRGNVRKTTFKNINLVVGTRNVDGKAIFYPSPKSVENMTITCQDDTLIPRYDAMNRVTTVFGMEEYSDSPTTIIGYLRINNCSYDAFSKIMLGYASYDSSNLICIEGKKYPYDGTSC